MLPGYTQRIEGAKTNKFRLSRTSSACSDVQFNESDQVKLINYIVHREESFLNRKEKPLHDQSLIDEIQRILAEEDENADANNQSNGRRHPLSNRNAPNDSLNSSGRNSSARISSSSSSVDEDKNDDNNNKNSNLQNTFADTNDYKRPLIEEDGWMTIKGDFVMVYAVSGFD